MTFLRILWDDPQDPYGNVQHIAEHGLDAEEVEEAVGSPCKEGVSHSSGLPILWGYTLEGVYILVVYEQIDDETIRVVTAYPVVESQGK
jgi:hypothetical protein